MATCYNRNTAEYQSLLEIYESPIVVDSMINGWQVANRSTNIPTLFDVEQFIENQKVYNSLQKKQIGDSILENLRTRKLISRYQGDFYINNTAEGAIKGDPITLKRNKDTVERLLDFWQINSNAVKIEQTENSFRINIDDSKITTEDIIAETKDLTHAVDVIQHLSRMFPDLSIKVMNEADARSLYNSLPQFKESYQKKPDFKDVKSFYANGQAILIKGRVTSETAIEEILHPFINAVQSDASTLFGNLVRESRKTFPILYQEIESTYSNTAGFNQTDRDKELVTQSLSRYFKKEYENVPTISFRSKVNQFMKWLMDIFRDLSKWIVGKDLELYAGMLKESNTLSDLSKILNTGDLKFNLERAVAEDKRIYFKLSNKNQKILNDARGKAQSQKQINAINDLFNSSETSTHEKAFDDFTVSMTGKKNHPLVILNKADHKYINVETNEEYIGITTKIGGRMSTSYTIKKNDTIQSIAKKFNTTPEKIRELNAPSFDTNLLENTFTNERMSEIYVPQTEFDTNVEIGNDFDAIVGNVILQESIDNLDLKFVSKETAQEFVELIKERLSTFIDKGGILLPQVVIADGILETGSAIDILHIDTNGILEIIDLKTSKDSLNTIINGKLKYLQEKYPVRYGSIFYDPNKSHSEQQRFSKEELHSLQVNGQARILENQGYEVQHRSTLHVHTPTKGKGVNQKYTQKFKIERFNYHTQTEDILIGDPNNNNFALAMLVPIVNDATSENKLYNLSKKTGENEPEIEAAEEEAEDAAKDITKKVMATEAITDALMNFSTSQVSAAEAIKRMADDTTLLMSGKDALTQIDRIVSTIELAIIDRNVAPTFEKLLRESIQQLEDFITYMNDPDNYMNDPNYIGKVLNFAKSLSSYESLVQLKHVEGLQSKHDKLILKLRKLIGDIHGERDTNGQLKEGQEGLINSAIDNFAKQFIKSNSMRDFTEKEMIEILKWGKDIGMIEYQTGTMATSSDTILALMDKLFKQKRQQVLDRIEERNSEIRRLGSKLAKLNPGGKANYDFMIVRDEKGLPTGRYVQKIGKQYYDLQREASEGLKDEDGEPLEYVIKDKLSNMTKEEIEHNKKVYAAKKKFGKFREAEKVEDGKLVEGRYHRYSSEFIQERNKLMYFDGQVWQKRRRVPYDEWISFRTKYYNSSPYYRPDIGQDGFTGLLKEKKTAWFPKNEYVEKREVSEDGISMTDSKYDKLMSPTNALEEAQKEFYEMYVKYFEEELLTKLPMNTVQSMSGKISLQKDHAYANLKKGPGILANLWAKVKATPGGIKDFFLNKTQKSRIVLTDQDGKFKSSLPIFYVGDAQTEEGLQKLTDKIKIEEEKLLEPTLTPTENAKIKNEIEALKGRRARLQNKPKLDEINLDMADNLMRFSAMAENYEVMMGIEDTLGALIKILEKRKYTPSDGTELKTYKGGKIEKTGKQAGTSMETPRVVQRAKKWMKMVFYDDDNNSQNFFDKIAKGLISYSSLTYVGLNPWGNLNNYVIGRLNNTIENAGGLWYDRRAGARATKEFNRRMLPDFFKRMGGKTAVNDMLRSTGADIGPAQYDQYIPGSKYEALVNLFRMMDDKADIREVNKGGGKEGPIRRMMSWGYMLQDSAEYNVQTKVGMAILMSTKIYKSSDPEGSKKAMSLFDAYQYNQQTGKLELEEGYDTVIDYKTKKHKKMSDKSRYDIRQYIREVNIHIHGNYAYEDRMVMQSHTLGQLAAQFHKWIAPALKARYRPEYFDENLGWIQGRYITAWSFMTHIFKNLSDVQQASKDWRELKGETGKTLEQFSEEIAKKETQLKNATSPEQVNNLTEQLEELKKQKSGQSRAEMKIKNLHRMLAEISLILMTFMLKGFFQALWDDEDKDGSGNIKRFQNAFMYQLDRQRREMIQFIWVKDAYELMKSPISSMRMVKEMAEAFASMVQTPYVLGKDAIYPGDKDIRLDKRIYYQRGTRKGQLKVYKETKDALPLLYALNRWMSYDRVKNFWVGD
jgi:LysM repeat protein